MKDSSWQPWFVLSVLVVMFSFLVKGAKTPETIAFIAMCVVWNAGVITTKEALSGFSNSGMLAVGVLFVVVQAIERSQLAPWAAKHVFGMRTGQLLGPCLSLLRSALCIPRFFVCPPACCLPVVLCASLLLGRLPPPCCLWIPLCVFPLPLTPSTTLMLATVPSAGSPAASTGQGLTPDSTLQAFGLACSDCAPCASFCLPSSTTPQSLPCSLPSRETGPAPAASLLPSSSSP